MPVNVNLVEAQQARRVLDRLVGYKISPLLWDKVRRGLSAGRVQTVALRLIVDREREIRAFVKQEYWTHRCRSGRQEAAAFRAPGSPRETTRTPEICERRRHRDAMVRRSRWRRLTSCSRSRRSEKTPQSGAAVYYLDAAAGTVAQTALQREAHDDAGAAAL